MLHEHALVAYAACSCPKVHKAVLWGRLGGWLLALSFFFIGLLGTAVGTWQFLTLQLAPAALHMFSLAAAGCGAARSPVCLPADTADSLSRLLTTQQVACFLF